VGVKGYGAYTLNKDTFIVTIDDTSIKYIRSWALKNSGGVSVKRIQQKDADMLSINGTLLNKNNISSVVNSGTVTMHYSQNEISGQFSGSQGALMALCFEDDILSLGSFVFASFKIKTTEDVYITYEIFYHNDNTNRFQQHLFLEKDKWYQIYYKSKNATTDGGYPILQILTGQGDIPSSAFSISVKNINLKLNAYDIPNMSVRSFENRNDFIVDRNGNADFASIQSCIDYLKTFYDVENEECSIFVRNGVYDHECPYNVVVPYPFAAVNKGANRISIFGESKEKTIIRYVSNSLNHLKVIEIGGPCVVENIKVESLRDNTYSQYTGIHQNDYCIHNDADFNSAVEYETIVRNCILYSTNKAPVGAGLHDNQKQVYDSNKIVVDSYVAAAALYIHGNADGTTASGKNMSVSVLKNILISLSGGKALTLIDVNQSSFTDIPCELIGNLLYSSDPDNIVDSDVTTRYDKLPYCMGNNIEVLNG
jgi:hypothetical protein